MSPSKLVCLKLIIPMALYLKYFVCQCGLLLMDWWARQVGERGEKSIHYSTFIYILFIGQLHAFLWNKHIS